MSLNAGAFNTRSRLLAAYTSEPQIDDPLVVPNENPVLDPAAFRRKLKAMSLVSGREYFDTEHYTSEGECVRCPYCESDSSIFYQEVVDTLDEGITCEESIHCPSCDKQVAYWAYGSFDPEFALVSGTSNDQ